MQLPRDVETQIAERYKGHGRYYRGDYSQKGIDAIKKLRAEFPIRKTFLAKSYHPHDGHRYVLLKDQFPELLTGRILDVGSRENVIKKILSINAELVDKNAESTEPIDLEKAKLPYQNEEFDTVICLDTLEHIDNLHEVVLELRRITKRCLIISLPNCWRKTFVQMLRGRSLQQAYGLPPEKPMDRHRWFFNTEEIEDFFFYHTIDTDHPYRVRDVRAHMIPLHAPWKRALFNALKPLIPARHLKNIFVNTSFVVLERID